MSFAAQMSAHRKRSPLHPPTWALFLGCVCTFLHAHPYSVMWSEMTVSKDRVRVVVTTTIEDFFYLYTLTPDKDDKLPDAAVKASMEKHKAYIIKHLYLFDIDGKHLEGRVLKAERLKPLDESIPMSERVRYTLRYDLKMPPESLTLSQDFSGQGNALPTVISVKVTQEGHPARPMFVLDSKGMEILHFDWLKTPPLDKPPSPDEARRERQKRLGITNYGAVYSFLYVEAGEVRHEILIPLASLNLWVYVDRKKPSVLTVKEQDAGREKVFAFFARHNPIEIDGVAVRPRLARMDFYDLEFRDLARRPPPRPVPAYAARIGLILSYPSPGLPEQVKLTWDLFSQDVRQLHTGVVTPDESFRRTLTRKEPTLEWRRSDREAFPAIRELSLPEAPTLPVPVLSLLFLGALLVIGCLLKRRGTARGRTWMACLALAFAAVCTWPVARVRVMHPLRASGQHIDPAQARRIFGSLHRNVYRAFAYRGEGEVYDALAKSVDGELLATLYLQIRKGLEMREQGGAVSRVQDVEMERSEVETLNDAGTAPDAAHGFAIDCAWTVRGTVEHWGHIHARTNRYRARFEVRARGQAWKITAMDVRGQERVKFETRLRTW